MLVRVGLFKWVNIDHVIKIEARTVRSKIMLRITFENGIKDKVKFPSVEDRTEALDDLKNAMDVYDPPGPS